MGSDAQAQAPPKEKSTLEKTEGAAGAGIKKVGGAVGGTFDKIDDKMDQEVEIAGIKMPFVTLIMSILIIIGAFLPWTNVHSGYEENLGLIVLIMAILIIVFAAIKKPIIGGVFGLIAFILLILAIAVNGLDVLEYGFWVAFVGALLGFIFGFLKK